MDQMNVNKKAVRSDLSSLYELNHPEKGAVFGSKTALTHSLKKGKDFDHISEKSVDNYLEGNPSYTLHRQSRLHFKTKRVVIGGLQQLNQGDLADVKKYADSNDGVNFLLVVEDVFSKYIWVEPLLTKSNEDVLKALKKVYTSDDLFPSTFSSDKGTEFTGKMITSFFDKHDVRHFTSHGDTKAQFVERSIRTLKHKLFQLMTWRNSSRYIDNLQTIVKSLNNSFKKELGMSPSEVNDENAKSVFFRIYGDNIHDVIENNIDQNSRHTFSVGDFVRISVSKGIFEKKYNDTFSQEIFRITSVIETAPIQYTIEDLLHEDILGKFYKQQLQKVDFDLEFFTIENIVNRFSSHGVKHAHVEWKYYGKKFDSDIPLSKIQKL